MASDTAGNLEKMAQIPARNIPELFYKRMGYKLNGIKEELAYELGIENDKLIEWKSRENPVKDLLLYWADMPDTTVYVLYTVLNKLKQGSAIKILCEYLKGEPVHVRILVCTKSSNKIYDLRVAPDERLRDIIKNIPELANHDPESINCIMESAPRNPLDMEAKFFKGKQITLSTCDKQQRVSEPVRGGAVKQPSRHTTPIQESAGPDSSEQAASENLLNKVASAASSTQSNLVAIEDLLDIWPALSPKQVASLFKSRMNLPGCYILRRSRENEKHLSISIVSRNKKLLNFRIHESEGSFWIYDDQERFHSVRELVDYYSKHPIIENEQDEWLMLETAL